MTTTTTTAIVPFDPGFADPKRLALGGFPAGYSGLTRDADELDLRQFVTWCDDHQLDLFEVRRADIEAFARELECHGRARATVTRRLCTVTSFYRYAEEEGLLAHSLAVHVRRPRIDYESTPPGWTETRSEPSSWPPASATRARSGVAAGAQLTAGFGGDRS
jgi:integrase/recombinase XerD